MGFTPPTLNLLESLPGQFPPRKKFFITHIAFPITFLFFYFSKNFSKYLDINAALNAIFLHILLGPSSPIPTPKKLLNAAAFRLWTKGVLL